MISSLIQIQGKFNKKMICFLNQKNKMTMTQNFYLEDMEIKKK